MDSFSAQREIQQAAKRVLEAADRVDATDRKLAESLDAIDRLNANESREIAAMRADLSSAGAQLRNAIVKAERVPHPGTERLVAAIGGAE